MSSDACMVMLSPWVRSLSKTGSPCYRLCLNGGRLQPEPICKFGRKSSDLKTSVGFCDENPFPSKTIHRRADNVIPLAGACENRASGRDIFFTCVSVFFSGGLRVYRDGLSGILVFKLSYFHGRLRGIGRVRPGSSGGSWNGVALSGSGGRAVWRINGGTTLSWSMVG